MDIVVSLKYGDFTERDPLIEVGVWSMDLCRYIVFNILPVLPVLYRVSDEEVRLHVRRLHLQQNADYWFRRSVPRTGGGML